MKKIMIGFTGAMLCSHLVLGQQGAPLPSPPSVYRPANSAPAVEPSRFDLDFAGGTPQQLINAIEKASGRPVNAVIPKEYAQMELPPLKMREVTISSLFEALGLSSQKRVTYVSGTYGSSSQYQIKETYYSFVRGQSREGEPIWSFRYDGVVETPPQPSICRFWELQPLLSSKGEEVGVARYKVEDITTAIQTGWKLLETKTPPSLKFHPETGLLIAVGRPDDLKLIDSVLEQLRSVVHPPPPNPVPVPAKPETKKEAEPAKK